MGKTLGKIQENTKKLKKTLWKIRKNFLKGAKTNFLGD